MNNEVLEALRKLSTPTVSNAIELFNLRPRSHGFMSPAIRCLFPEMGVMVGYAVTGRFAAEQPPAKAASRYEFWQRSDVPEDARIIKGGAETSFNGNTADSYDASTNTIREQQLSQQNLPEDPVAKIRALLDSGDAQIVDTTTLDGHAVLKIQAHSSDDMLFNGTIYVVM